MNRKGSEESLDSGLAGATSLPDIEGIPASGSGPAVPQEPKIDGDAPGDAPNLNIRATPATTSIKRDDGAQATGDGGASKPRKVSVSQPLMNMEETCLLLADTTLDSIPLHLQHLLDHFEGDNLTQAELLLLLIYCVGLESGFVSQVEFEMYSDEIDCLSPSMTFHSKNVQFVGRQAPTFRAINSKSHLTMHLHNIAYVPYKCRPSLLNALLTCLVTGDYLIVTLTPARGRTVEGRSMCLSIGRYVLNTQPVNRPVYHRFRKLDELSMILRENLYLPVRNRQLAVLEISPRPSLLGLPNELFENMFQHLNQNDLKIVANVCKQLNFLSTHSKYFQK